MYESGARRKVLRYKCILGELSVDRCHVDAQEVIQKERRVQRMGIKTESREVSQANARVQMKGWEEREEFQLGDLERLVEGKSPCSSPSPTKKNNNPY